MRRKWSIRELAALHAERQAPSQLPDTVLWLHDIRSMHNVGSVFRTADGFGIRRIWLSGYTPTPPRPEIHKTALGADKSVAWTYFPTAQDAFDALEAEGVETGAAGLIVLLIAGGKIPAVSIQF
jgi:tRNA G18 (ribose-2'-O)-methylase SpoU